MSITDENNQQRFDGFYFLREEKSSKFGAKENIENYKSLCTHAKWNSYLKKNSYNIRDTIPDGSKLSRFFESNRQSEYFLTNLELEGFWPCYQTESNEW